MQDAAALVARFFAQATESAIGFIDQDQRIRICHNPIISETIHVSKLIHNDNSNGLLSPARSDHSCSRNYRASARLLKTAE
jgi:hypothetical protein